MGRLGTAAPGRELIVSSGHARGAVISTAVWVTGAVAMRRVHTRRRGARLGTHPARYRLASSPRARRSACCERRHEASRAEAERSRACGPRRVPSASNSARRHGPAKPGGRRAATGRPCPAQAQAGRWSSVKGPHDPPVRFATPRPNTRRPVATTPPRAVPSPRHLGLEVASRQAPIRGSSRRPLPESPSASPRRRDRRVAW
jgi:hypothetical protein